MSQEEIDREIIEEINALLGDGGPSDEPRPAAPPPPPTVGTYVQRSDRTTAKKWAMLTTPLPPMPKRTPRVKSVATCNRRVKIWPTPQQARAATAAAPPKATPPAIPVITLPEEPTGGPTNNGGEDRPCPVLPKPGTSQDAPLTLIAPTPLPPIWVEVEPGYAVPVPHFAVHSTRKYRVRNDRGKWNLRFDSRGQLRYRRRIA